MTKIFDDLPEETISQLLLDYARGNLSDDKRSQIDEAVRSDMALAEELEYYKGLANPKIYQNDITAPGELGWARLSKAIDEEEKAQIALETIPQSANDNLKFWRRATAALAAVAFIQFGFLGVSQFTNSSTDTVYATVSEETEKLESKITFTSAATQADITEMLLATDAEIVRGPSALGVYTIRFASEEKKLASIQDLKAMDSLIETITNTK